MLGEVKATCLSRAATCAQVRKGECLHLVLPSDGAAVCERAAVSVPLSLSTKVGDGSIPICRGGTRLRRVSLASMWQQVSNENVATGEQSSTWQQVSNEARGTR